MLLRCAAVIGKGFLLFTQAPEPQPLLTSIILSKLPDLPKEHSKTSEEAYGKAVIE